jgi:hypothetical protein
MGYDRGLFCLLVFAFNIEDTFAYLSVGTEGVREEGDEDTQARHDE